LRSSTNQRKQVHWQLFIENVKRLDVKSVEGICHVFKLNREKMHTPQLSLRSFGTKVMHLGMVCLDAESLLVKPLQKREK
jgi:hypothetical protein